MTNEELLQDFKTHLLDYKNHGRIPGGFLTAVLEDSLSGAINRAAHQSLAILPDIVGFIWNDLPRTCWGSRKRVSDWAEVGGLNGK